MTSPKRVMTVLALAVAVVLAATAHASAGWAETVTSSTVSLSTVTVAAPTQVEAKLICSTTVDPVTGATTTTASTLKIEWWQSTTPGVTGYLITAHPSSGAPYELRRVGPTDETFTTADPALLASQTRFSVTTLTGYGWTRTSATTGIRPC